MSWGKSTRHQRPKRWITWLPPLLWMGVIFFLSSLSAEDLPVSLPDKLGHFGVFLILGILLFRALRMTTSLKLMPCLVLVALAASSYGIIDELHQHFTPGRYPDIWDWVADTAGAFAAVLVCLIWERCNRHEKTNRTTA